VKLFRTVSAGKVVKKKTTKFSRIQKLKEILKKTPISK
jgi:hypothetical protein